MKLCKYKNCGLIVKCFVATATTTKTLDNLKLTWTIQNLIRSDIETLYMTAILVPSSEIRKVFEEEFDLEISLLRLHY